MINQSALLHKKYYIPPPQAFLKGRGPFSVPAHSVCLKIRLRSIILMWVVFWLVGVKECV
jgi:hypothetical protein